MKSSRMLLLVAATMMSSVYATKNPNAIRLEQFLVGDLVDENKNSLIHMWARHCGNEEVELRIKPYTINKQIELAAQSCFPDVSKEEALQLYGQSQVVKAIDLFLAKNAAGQTPLDILNERGCEDELCIALRELIELMSEK